MTEPEPRCSSLWPWESELVVALWRENPGYAVIDIPWGAAIDLTEQLARLDGLRAHVRREVGRLRRRQPIIIQLRRRWKLLLFRSLRRDDGCSPRPAVVCPDSAPQHAITFSDRTAAHAHARGHGTRDSAWFTAHRYQESWLDSDGILWSSPLEPILCDKPSSDPYLVYDNRRVRSGATSLGTARG